jgi:hypothetical protein
MENAANVKNGHGLARNGPLPWGRRRGGGKDHGGPSAKALRIGTGKVAWRRRRTLRNGERYRIASGHTVCLDSAQSDGTAAD